MERAHAGLARKEITLADGTHVVYLEGGSGEPLVLVHGFGADKDNFTRVARWLTPHYRVIVPDLVGFGESSHLPDVDYHYAAQAQRVRAFVQALGLQRVDLGGNSMGGGIAMSYAAQHPQEVHSLWLVDCAGIAGAPPSESLAKITGERHGPQPVDGHAGERLSRIAEVRDERSAVHPGLGDGCAGARAHREPGGSRAQGVRADRHRFGQRRDARAWPRRP